jgi:predicted lysophospholipase L1 biosynthesis ABC-type transport system permease subunit
MKEEQDYINDLAEIRSMMERSSKFLSLSGLAGVMAGLYALAGAWIAYSVLNFTPQTISSEYYQSVNASSNLTQLILLACLVLVLAVGTAIWFSYRKANKRGESIWNATSKRLLASISVPLLTGGLLILILLSKSFISLIAPLTLIFYGLALYNASKFSYEEVKYLGMIQIALGLLSTLFTGYGLLFWAIGFGAVHIVYGIFIHIRYER